MEVAQTFYDIAEAAVLVMQILSKQDSNAHLGGMS
jgi:hypothetical protein